MSRRSSRNPLALMALCVLPALACSRMGGTAAPQFPSEQALSRIQSAPRPSPEAVFRRPPAAVDQWQLTTPLPDTIGAVPYRGPDADLRAIAERYGSDTKQRRVTEGLSCYAREQGRFWLAHQGAPPEDIQRFITARCGAAAAQLQVQFRYRERTAGSAMPTIASNAETVNELFSDAPARSVMGAWVGADDRYEVVAVATGVSEVALEPMPMTVERTGFVDIVGTLGGKPGWVQGFATRGDRGFAHCSPLPSHQGTTLALRCPVSPDDDYAMIEVFAAAPDEILGHSLLSLMVLPRPVASPTQPLAMSTSAGGNRPAPAVQVLGYAPPVQTPVQGPVRPPVQAPVQTPVQSPVRPSVQAPVQAPTKAPVRAPTPTPTPAPTITSVPLRGTTERADTYRAAVVALPIEPHDHSPASYLAAINHLRRQENLEPLELATQQSDTVASLLPYYLAAQGEGDTKGAEQIALGLMAGWDVTGIIRDAGILSFFGHHSWTVDRALGAALLSPAYRALVFDPDDRALALGTVDDQERGARAFMLLTYQFFTERSYEAEQTALLDELDRQRAAGGLEPITRLRGPQSRSLLAESAQRVREGAAEPIDELNRLLQSFVDETSRGFQGQVTSTLVLDGWRPEFPRDLVRADQAWVALVVTHREAPGSAWGEHVVMMVYSM